MKRQIVGLLSLVIFVKLMLNYRKRRSLEINEVLFFPDKEYPCTNVTRDITSLPPKHRICHNPSCRKLHNIKGESPSSMIKFLEYLAGAKQSVDLCVYVFTEPTLAEILDSLNRSGVKVCIITDGHEDEAYNSQVSKLLHSGIQIKSNPSGKGALMHHKFVVIDKKILLSGSFNWTNSAVVSNFEAVMVTSNKNLVDPFIVEFSKLWSKFKPHGPIGISTCQNLAIVDL